MKDLQVTTAPGTETLIVYEGAARVIREPKILNISGILDSPLRWLQIRKDNLVEQFANIIVNREKLTIALHLCDKDYFGDTITGKAEFHPVFIRFAINGDKYITNLEMAKLFKMNRSFFENQSTAMGLVTELQNFKAKINLQMEKSDDNRGNKSDLLARTVESNLPDKFNLILPIFKGQPKQTIEVEVYINPSDLTCCLVSPMANDLTEAFRDEIIDTQINQIKVLCPAIVIIEE